MIIFTKQRIKILVCLAVITPMGFLMWRCYRGPADNWVRFYVPDVLYVIFWSLVFFFFRPKKANVVRIPVIVFIATCILEFLQLWQPEFLQRFRATIIGAALIGTDFVWLQFPYYILGSVVSIFLLSILAEKGS